MIFNLTLSGRFVSINIGPNASSWNEKTIKGVALMKGGTQVAPVVLDCTCNPL